MPGTTLQSSSTVISPAFVQSWPKGSVCGVVFQNWRRYKACQFTFACEGRSLSITEPESWRDAARIARDVTEGQTYLANVGDATHTMPTM